MPRIKDEPQAEAATEAPVTQPEQPLQPFFYPTIGDGTTVMAASQEEADEKIRKIQLQ